MLQRLAGDGGVPTHAALVDALRAAAADADARCADPDPARHDAAQAGWHAARRPERRGKASAFGPPVDDDRALALPDLHPRRLLDVEALLASGEPVDADPTASCGATVRVLVVAERPFTTALACAASVTVTCTDDEGD